MKSTLQPSLKKGRYKWWSIHLHFPEKNSVYFGQRKHWCPQLRKKNKLKERKKCIFLDPPAGFQEER